MAARIGLRRAWFQAGRVPHYDLTPARRQAALDDGAVFVAAKEQARARRRAREGAVINGHRYAFGDVSVSIDGVDVRAVSPIAVEPSDEP